MEGRGGDLIEVGYRKANDILHYCCLTNASGEMRTFLSLVVQVLQSGLGVCHNEVY